MTDAELLKVWPGEYWRRRGYALVLRLGSADEREEARQRCAYVIRVRNMNEAWLAAQRKLAA